MDLDTRQQPPPASTAPSNSMPSSQPLASDNPYYSQQQQFNASPQLTTQTPEEPSLPPQSQPQYQKHQPLIDHSSTMSPDIYDSPTVGFSNGPSDESGAFNAQPYSSLAKTTRTLNMRYQIFLDRISPHWKARWAFSLFALLVFMARVLISQGWYVICYALAIYYLNLLIGFISPKVDPGLGSLDDDDELGDAMLPTRASDEFRPFIRRLPEFKFWISGTKATLISLFLSLFDLFDVPVFWPILLIYFVILFACTMRQQIQHMIRYSYVPWDSGKKKYTGATSDSSSSFNPQTV